MRLSWVRVLTVLSICLSAVATATGAEGKRKLQIGVKKRVDHCPIKSRKGDVLHMHYTGKLEDGTEFDSSLPQNQPFVFSLGTGQVIKGWDQGLLGMCEGEKRKLVIPSELGKRPLLRVQSRLRCVTGKGESCFSLSLVFTISIHYNTRLLQVWLSSSEYRAGSLKHSAVVAQLCPCQAFGTPFPSPLPFSISGLLAERGRTPSLCRSWKGAWPSLTVSLCIFNRVWRAGSSPKDSR
ncbi:peptidyl-prolyl cis-trans isomerase FKBP2 isoform X3 [Theropithecus gelada]|uniref:peptidyl-prolyl cis-trans isomerase FKBP2 isoform X3 n=1 Tax=Theropithecus gelada TaxID=9565 RepID=UPI000DC18536|nr:peptidyl-prolyl cis-trans isomerase FKBP2 isoform X3 [Theropithecus gelada]